MAQFLKRKPKEEPARQRYPEELWTLLTLGKPDENIDYGQLAKPLADYVPDLIHMALDEDLNYRKESDPAVWAPLHAIHILGALGAVEAAEPLTQCLDWDDDWIGEALPGIYASIGQRHRKKGVHAGCGGGHHLLALQIFYLLYTGIRSAKARVGSSGVDGGHGNDRRIFGRQIQHCGRRSIGKGVVLVGHQPNGVTRSVALAHF